MAASSAPRGTSAADAPTSAEHRTARPNRAGEPSHTPTVAACPASETTPTGTFTATAADGGGRRATPHVRDSPGTLEARATVTRPVMGEIARPTRLPPVVEASVGDGDGGGHIAPGPRRTGRVCAQGAQAQSAPLT
eukprot:5398881-Pleurochrysis_carterae.AAC.1